MKQQLYKLSMEEGTPICELTSIEVNIDDEGKVLILLAFLRFYRRYMSI